MVTALQREGSLRPLFVREGFIICWQALPDYEDYDRAYAGRSMKLSEHRAQMAEVFAGETHLFVSEVSAWKHGRLFGRATISGCFWQTPEAFITESPYFEQMVEEALVEARMDEPEQAPTCGSVCDEMGDKPFEMNDMQKRAVEVAQEFLHNDDRRDLSGLHSIRIKGEMMTRGGVADLLKVAFTGRFKDNTNTREPRNMTESNDERSPEGTAEHDLQQAMRGHDWHYARAEDRTVVREGTDRHKRINYLYKQLVALVGTAKAVEVWNELAPEDFKRPVPTGEAS